MYEKFVEKLFYLTVTNFEKVASIMRNSLNRRFDIIKPKINNLLCSTQIVMDWLRFMSVLWMNLLRSIHIIIDRFRWRHSWSLLGFMVCNSMTVGSGRVGYGRRSDWAGSGRMWTGRVGSSRVWTGPLNWIGSVGRPGRVGLRYQWLHCTFCIAFILPVEQVGDIDLEGKEWRWGGREGRREGG